MGTCLRLGIADDNSDLRMLLGQLITTLGHHVLISVENGRLMLDACALNQIDVALVDLDMPEVDGLAVADELHNSKRIPVILMSGHADFQEIVRRKEPIRAYLRKPFSLQALQEAIESAARDHGSGG
jgi:CheY-like chemotaxis protein